MIPDQEDKHKFILHIFIFCIISLIFIASGITSYVLYQERKLSTRVLPQVFIDNIHVGGKTKAEIQTLFNRQIKSLKQVRTRITYQEDVIATLSAEKLNIKLNIDDVIERAYLIGRVSHVPSAIYQKIVSLLKISRFDFETVVQYQTEPLTELLSQVELEHNKSAKNALFQFENNRVIEFRPEKNGIQIERQQFLDSAEVAIQNLKKQPKHLVIPITSSILKPEITLARANDYGIEELIGEGISDYSHSIPEREHNVILGTSKFNGVLIPPNKLFSFNETVGDISSTTGYKPAYIIKNGRTVLGDGGGICQVSTTLFRAALTTGLPVIERTAHAYRVSYYENDAKPGLDATVYAPSVDLKIKNDTSSYILIQTEVEKEHKKVYFRLFGKKDGRKSELSPIVLYDVSPPPEAVRQDDPTLKKGVVKQVDFAAWGGKSTYTYKVTYPNNEVKEEKFFSSYRPWQAVFLVGTSDN